jgi:hypothetical protein
MENARQLQCKPLRELEKIRRRKNNGKQWKKQCAEQWKQSEIRASADVRLRPADLTPGDPRPIDRGEGPVDLIGISALALFCQFRLCSDGLASFVRAPRPRRHARACGHPRLRGSAGQKDVDGRAVATANASDRTRPVVDEILASSAPNGKNIS